MYLQIVRNRRQSVPFRAVWGNSQVGQETGGKRRLWPKAFIEILWEEIGKAR